MRELSGGTQPSPGRGLPPAAPQTSSPSHSAARPAARAAPRGGGESLTAVTLPARPGAAGSHRQAPYHRPASVGSGARLSRPTILTSGPGERRRRSSPLRATAAEAERSRGRGRGGGWSSPSALACCGSPGLAGRAVTHALASSRDRLGGTAFFFFFLPFSRFF